MQGPPVEFTRLWDDDIKKYAFYTLIDGDPAKRAYLLPVPDNAQSGHRKYTVRAVQTVDQTATGKYVFEVADNDYPNVGVETKRAGKKRPQRACRNKSSPKTRPRKRPKH